MRARRKTYPLGDGGASVASIANLPVTRPLTARRLLYADARTASRALSPQDAWIAATALALDAPLATNNRRDFESIRKLQLLTL